MALQAPSWSRSLGKPRRYWPLYLRFRPHSDWRDEEPNCEPNRQLPPACSLAGHRLLYWVDISAGTVHHGRFNAAIGIVDDMGGCGRHAAADCAPGLCYHVRLHPNYQPRSCYGSLCREARSDIRHAIGDLADSDFWRLVWYFTQHKAYLLLIYDGNKKQPLRYVVTRDHVFESDFIKRLNASVYCNSRPFVLGMKKILGRLARAKGDSSRVEIHNQIGQSCCPKALKGALTLPLA